MEADRMVVDCTAPFFFNRINTLSFSHSIFFVSLEVCIYPKESNINS